MPPIRSFTSKRRILLTISISLNKEIISPYSYYVKKGLVYIIITEFFSYQSFFYAKCTKLNIYVLCDMYLIPLNKYRFLYYIYYYIY